MPATPHLEPGLSIDPSAPVVGSIRMSIDRTTPVVAFAPRRGAFLHVGPTDDLEHTPVVITAPSPEALTHWLSRAITAVIAAAPSADPDPGPDPLVVEARQVLVEDVLRLLGVPTKGLPIEIDELGQSDIRAARRLAQRAVDLLDAAIDAEPIGDAA